MTGAYAKAPTFVCARGQAAVPPGPVGERRSERADAFGWRSLVVHAASAIGGSQAYARRLVCCARMRQTKGQSGTRSWFSWGRFSLVPASWARSLALVGVLAGALACDGAGKGTEQPGSKDGSEGAKQRSHSPISIAAGSGHACVLRESGKVACWGRNDQGQLGDGTTEDRSSAVAVQGLADVVELALGRDHTCARRSDGAVLCWGSNARGQLGIGQAGAGSRRPVMVRGLSDAKAIASGDEHTCALRNDGPMVCWGDNRDGQLGNAAQPMWTEPAPLRTIVDASVIAAGSRHTCALREGGKVICWGANASGQLGDGTTEGHERASSVVALPAVVALAAAGSSTCAVGGEGVYCWGAIADGSKTSRPIKLTEGSANDPISEVALGPEHGCVRHRGGQVRCWGDNRDGRLGTGDFSSQARPVSVQLGGAASDLALGGRHSCALRADAKVLCWGDDAGGALGRGETSQEQAPGGVRRVLDISDAGALGTGDGFSCALRRSGEVWCWGRNELGQLGDGGPAADRFVPAPVDGIEDAVALAVGEAQACVARKTGAVACWGANDQGQLGRPAGEPLRRPVAVPKVESAISVSLGSAHGCAIQQGGAVLCWGSDAEGQLGDGAGARGGKVANLGDAVALSSGRAHTCALRKSGAVSCWGSNVQGQLGNGAGAAQLKQPAHVPVTVAKLGDASEVSAGPDHTCARKRDGQAVCWGRNDQGQLGSGTASHVWTSRVPVQNLAGVTALDVGAVHACAAMGSRIACWGDNAAEQGGYEGASSATPRIGHQDVDAVELALGRDHSCARLRSGEVACWGSNEHGQLGDGGRTVSSQPVEVSGI